MVSHAVEQKPNMYHGKIRPLYSIRSYHGFWCIMVRMDTEYLHLKVLNVNSTTHHYLSKFYFIFQYLLLFVFRARCVEFDIQIVSSFVAFLRIFASL